MKLPAANGPTGDRRPARLRRTHDETALLSVPPIATPMRATPRTIVLLCLTAVVAAAAAGCMLFAPPQPPPAPPPLPAMPAPNPWLTSSAAPTSHGNPARTAAVLTGGPVTSKTLARARDAKVVWNVLASNPTAKKIDTDTVLFASGPFGLRKIFATGKSFEPLSFLPYPGFEERARKADTSAVADLLARVDAARRARDDAALGAAIAGIERLGVTFDAAGNGLAALIDAAGFHYCVYGGTKILKSTDDDMVRGPMRAVKTVDVAKKLRRKDAAPVTRIGGLAMTYDGHLAAAASGALVILDRDLNVKVHLPFADESVHGGVAVDERNGLYVLTSRRLRKVVWTGERLSTDEADGAWDSEYEVAAEAAAGGATTTPTLMGFGDDPDKLVVIADAAPTGTNLVAFWRDAIPPAFVQKPATRSRRIADQVRITIAHYPPETPPNVLGYGVAVANGTYPQPYQLRGLPNAFTAGVTRPAPLGIAKLTWNPTADRFEPAWINAEVDNADGAVPVVSAKTGLLYAAHKVDGNHQYVGLDWQTGAIRARWIFPDDSRLWNAFGAVTTILEDGDLVIGGAFGLKRILGD